MAGSARHGKDERVVAEARFGRAPGGQVGQGVGPADADASGVGGLPAVAAAAHPVSGIGEGHGAETVLARERNGAIHRLPGVQIAGAAFAIPAFERAAALDSLRLSLDIDAAGADHADETREAVEAVGVDAIACSFGEETGTASGALGRKAESAEGCVERFN